jgi:hypothetical protein
MSIDGPDDDTIDLPGLIVDLTNTITANDSNPADSTVPYVGLINLGNTWYVLSERCVTVPDTYQGFTIQLVTGGA